MTGRSDSGPTAVYRLFGSTGVLLYVGRSRMPDERIGQHRREKRWFSEVAQREVAWYPTTEEADRAERAAICTELPKYNRSGNPARTDPGSGRISIPDEIAHRVMHVALTTGVSVRTILDEALKDWLDGKGREALAEYRAAQAAKTRGKR